MKNPEYRQPFIPISWNNRELARINEVVFDQTGKQLYVRTSETQYDSLIKNDVFRPALTDEPQGTIGFVPAPKAGDESKLLIGNAEWVSVEELVGRIGSFKGATLSTSGGSGFVPAPKKTDVNNFLCGDGTFKNVSDVATTFAVGKNGLVPASTSGDTSKVLTGNGQWKNALDVTTDFKGSSSNVAGTRGVVPAPAAGYQNKYLQGNGYWSNPVDVLPNFGGARDRKSVV